MSVSKKLLTAFLAGGVGAGLYKAYSVLDFDTCEDARLFVSTEDNWNLSVYHYRPSGSPKYPFPIVMSHGFAGSKLSFDLGVGHSLARYLADSGFNVFTLDLRGRGQSWPSSGPDRKLQWSFDDFVTKDLPAVMAKACDISGASEGFWVGLEMSGQVLYAACISRTTDQVRGAVTLGSPVFTPSSAHVPGITATPRVQFKGRIPFKAGARLGGPILAATHSSQLETSFRPANTDPLVTARFMWNGVFDESSAIAEQFLDWVENKTMRDRAGTIEWSDHLDEIKLPLLIMAAAHDLQRPPEATRETYEAFGSLDKTFILAGKESGYSVDFGHDDLISARAAKEEVWPQIRDWLAGHSVI